MVQFGVLLSSVEATAFRYAQRKTPTFEDARDVLQEARIKAWKNFHTYDQSRPFQRWFLQILSNVIIDQYRRSEKHTLSGVEEQEERIGSASAEIENTPLRLAVLEAMQNLPQLERCIIYLRYFQDLDSAEIGALVRLPKGTVRRKLLEARAVLRQILAGWNPDGGGPYIRVERRDDGDGSVQPGEIAARVDVGGAGEFGTGGGIRATTAQTPGIQSRKHTPSQASCAA